MCRTQYRRIFAPNEYHAEQRYGNRIAGGREQFRFALKRDAEQMKSLLGVMAYCLDGISPSSGRHLLMCIPAFMCIA
jgi:hypothetical protein